MKLNYFQRKNGMYVLNKSDMEQIATDILKEKAPMNLEYPIHLNLEAFLDSFGLLQKKAFLGIPGHEILGVIIMGDSAEFVGCDTLMTPIVMVADYGTVLLHQDLYSAKNLTRLRYTATHEVSHWVLHREYFDHLPKDVKSHHVACRKIENNYRQEKRTTDNDWMEWQADTLAAAMLMPKEVFFDFAKSSLRSAGAGCGYLIEGQPKDRAIFNEAIEPISKQFRVSRRAAQIRMIHLGLIRNSSIF